MSDFDKRYQDERNGPLKKELRDRLRRFRSVATLAEIGKEVNLHGSTISQILNEKHPARVGSQHIPRIVRAIEEGEKTYAKEFGLAASRASEPKDPLRYHVDAIEALGWKVTLERRAS